MAQNRGWEWQNFVKKNWRNFVTLGADFESQDQTMISPDYVLCNKPWHFGKIWKFCTILDSFGKCWEVLDFFWKISNYNLLSRRQIMTERGVYWNIILHIWNGFYTWSHLKISFLSLTVIGSNVDILQLPRPLTASY